MGGRRQSDKSNKSDPERTGATEPITLMDPDGAVTRVAPWSTWTREQVRAPGGEPSLVTRLDQGQLWFAAGRRQSPWRHEVVVGPATVSTPRGRFHVTAETDGGATVACLAGRTRVVAGLSEPVVLTANQTAAVSSDGATLVVMDRGRGDGAGVLSDDWDDGREPPQDSAGAVPGGDDPQPNEAAGAEPVVAMAAGGGGSDGGGDDGLEGSDDGDGPRRPWRRIPEFIAIAALLGVLIAAVVVFGSGSDSSEIVDSSGSSSTVGTPTTKTTTSTSTTTTTTTTPTTTSTTSTTVVTTPSTIVVPGTATGSLAGCRRAAGGVEATVAVTHRSGGPGRFLVRVGLVDSAGTLFARGEANTSLIDAGGSASVDVLIRLDGAAQGSCELLEVVPA